MLSILIPTYNYNAFPLVLELHKQCLESNIEFEILCQDDASKEFLVENSQINKLENCFFASNERNLGRGRNINFLAEKAKFDWLLIMDCDTFPTENKYIHNYISKINDHEKIVFGGIKYKEERPNEDQLLRWFYGNARESLSVDERKKNPNAKALTSNLLIRKNIFNSNKFDITIIKYGYEDLLFLSKLKKKGILVNHINNATYHLGLETSQQFLNKTKTALENLKLITETNPIDSSESKILKVSNLLNKFYLTAIISFLFQKTESKITANLLSEKPSLLLFDLYKLGYYCSISNK